ncbi:endonuclease/exonuclease/phosphatase family protein [Planomonospora sp. ID91781]|uniref:endonuclease/exonuclease/phosphatase family protein n=1 Tax=Planomonospora sp. ID91781 TaxID=2738135 RepID=UPI0018C40D25|nr:endonuclease/exonuclease/phosphatase family protein [Planomonospora sp. ID91781]MBG0823921.1 endonuclease/exonuclease/phosphatase family protein [Planomonospora sp. ID91781]
MEIGDRKVRAAGKRPRRVGRWHRGEVGAPGRTSWSWTRGRVLAAVAVLVAGLLAFPGAVPDAAGNPGGLLETFLPWGGLAVPVLTVLALLRRSVTAMVSLVLPAAVWAALFGERLLPGDRGTAHDLTVLQHNVNDENPDPEGTARALAQAGADLIALEELTPGALPVYESALASGHPHHAVVGTVGLWSRYPLADTRPVDIKPVEVTGDWSRGMRSTVRTPYGEAAVYVAHLPSVRIRLPDGFGTGRRDESAAALGAAIAAEKQDRIVLLGDLNGTLDDRGLAPVTSRLTPAEEGFGFSWPAVFPVARIDHVMTRAATPVTTWTLPATGSDHLAVAARIKF